MKDKYHMISLIRGQNKLLSKIEPEAHKCRTDWQLAVSGEGEVGTHWKKVKGLVKEHVGRTHGHGQGVGTDYGSGG